MARQMKKIAVIGAGLMGSGIATALLLSNYTVILKEVNQNYLQAGIARVRGKDDALFQTGLDFSKLVVYFD